MRWVAAVAACSLFFFAGCGGSSSSSSGSGGGSLSPQVPKANAGGPYTGSAGVPVTFNGAASSDPQGQALTFTWNFGDGTNGTGINPTHTYPQVPGTSIYNVSLTVQNTSGLSNQASTTATIQGIAPLPDAGLSGIVATGNKAIVGAHVYLFAAGSTGYGLPSVSLLSGTETGTSDSVGAYVLTNASGAFTMSGDYTCTAGQQLYIYAAGGDSGSGQNSASVLLAAIGPCPSSSGPAISVRVNEVSTVATAFSAAGFATDATHVSSSGTPLAQAGIANAFANVSNLETLSTGVALAATPSGSGVAPQAKLNALANVLATCVDPSISVSNACNLLFTNTFYTGSAPTNTAAAAINIAHNPAFFATSLFQIPASAQPYAPTLSTSPADFTMALSFSGGGLNGPQGIAVDGSGSVWIANLGNNSVTKLSSLGAVLSGASGYTGNGLNIPNAIAIDQSGNAWVANGGGSVTKISSTGAFLSGTTGYTVGGLNQPAAIAIDGLGNAWVANFGANSVTELSGSGTALSGGLGYAGGALNHPIGIAVDGSGNAWAANQSGNSVTKLSPSGSSLSGANGYSGGGINTPFGVAINATGTAWITNGNNGSLSEISNSGTILSPPSGYPGGLAAASEGIAIDGASNVWIANQNAISVTALSNGGALLPGPSIYSAGTLNSPRGIAIDGAGNAWVTNNGNNTVSEYVGIAAPVVTPIAAGLPAAPTANGSSSLGTTP
jgi:PKD domain